MFWGKKDGEMATLLWVEKKMGGVEWGFEGVEVRGAEVGCFLGCLAIQWKCQAVLGFLATGSAERDCCFGW